MCPFTRTSALLSLTAYAYLMIFLMRMGAMADAEHEREGITIFGYWAKIMMHMLLVVLVLQHGPKSCFLLPLPMDITPCCFKDVKAKAMGVAGLIRWALSAEQS
jgi:hypothetical protein